MKKQKAMNLYWQGMYFRYGSLCESFLRKRLAVPKVLQTNGFGTYFCICRKIMVQPCAWMKWQRTSGSAEASAAAILRNMPANHFRLSAPVSHSREHVSADRNRQNHCTDCSGLRIFPAKLLCQKIPGADRHDARAISGAHES